VVNFMHFIARDVRETMARLGFRTFNEMVGRTDKLVPKRNIEHWKAKTVDLSRVLARPRVPASVGRYCQIAQDHGLEQTLDAQTLIPLCQPALEWGERVSATLPIHNDNRVTGTMLGSQVTQRYGAEGLPEDTIHLHFQGSAGQSFGAFLPPGITLELEGDANDYVGKGLSGGKIIVRPPEGATFVPEENIIIGNVAFYGATSGQAYIRGMAGERFCVRNSGLHAVVEAIGDHGCEYMTGGRVVVLGATGRNFGAGMSGGIAYVLDEGADGGAGDFAVRCNRDMVALERMEPAETAEVKAMIQRHVSATGSERGRDVLARWSEIAPQFVKVMPRDYKRMLQAIQDVKRTGLSGEAAIMAAFELNKADVARVSGN
jgi:glutamate synthase (ferredoxin)